MGTGGRTDGKIAYPVEELFDILGLTRTAGYDAIAKGELETYKVGRRRYGTRKAAEKYAELKQRQSAKAAA